MPVDQQPRSIEIDSDPGAYPGRTGTTFRACIPAARLFSIELPHDETGMLPHESKIYSQWMRCNACFLVSSSHNGEGQCEEEDSRSWQLISSSISSMIIYMNN